MKKLRKISVLVVMFILICVVLSGCGKKEKVYYAITEEQFEQIMQLIDQNNANNENQTQAPVSEGAEEEKPLKVTITENDQKLHSVEPKVFESMYEVTSNNPSRLNGEGTISILLFDVDVKSVTVTNEKSGYSAYTEITAKNNTDYYSLSYECVKGTRLVFKVTTDNKEYFFSLKC